MKLKLGPGLGLLCACLMLGACRPAAGWRWERAEGGLPQQAAFLALAADPSDPSRLWAGYYAFGGLATSRDGGQTWITGAQGLGDNAVFDLLAFPGGRVWAATRDGLLQSGDGGSSWHPAAGLPPAPVYALAADATGRIYAGLDDAGPYRQEAGGDRWTALGAGAEKLASAAVLALAVSPDGATLYAGSGGQGLFASRDAGRTWSIAFPDAYAPDLALDPARPATAVASLRDRLVRTRDGGQTWTIVPVPWARDEVVSLLWSDPIEKPDSRLWAGTGRGRVYLSRDGGDTWLEGGDGLPASGGVLALGRAGDRLVAGTWTGVYASDDDGRTWTYLSPALGFPFANALLPTRDGLLLGARGGLFRWQPAERAWKPVMADPPPGGVMALAAAPSDARIVYAGMADGGVYRSQDGGAQWAPVVPDKKFGIRALVVAPDDPNHVYALAFWERMYESVDGGQHWRARWTGLGVTTEAISLARDPLDPLTLYLGAFEGLYRSRYGGQDWQPAGHALDGQTVLALVARTAPGDGPAASILYIGATRGTYRSLDGGDTVQPWGQGLEGLSVTALLFDPNDPQAVYAGTAYAGLYRSADGGQTWQPFGPDGLDGEIVEALAWGPGGELFAATPGGVWMGSRE
jgi:photosystem II stability/assembly factor-like uncharacterized protein